MITPNITKRTRRPENIEGHITGTLQFDYLGRGDCGKHNQALVNYKILRATFYRQKAIEPKTQVKLIITEI